MEQFSHDLTLALEETSRSGGVRSGRWGTRRRTRSTGNLRKLRFKIGKKSTLCVKQIYVHIGMFVFIIYMFLFSYIFVVTFIQNKYSSHFLECIFDC